MPVTDLEYLQRERSHRAAVWLVLFCVLVLAPVPLLWGRGRMGAPPDQPAPRATPVTSAPGPFREEPHPHPVARIVVYEQRAAPDPAALLLTDAHPPHLTYTLTLDESRNEAILDIPAGVYTYRLHARGYRIHGQADQSGMLRCRLYTRYVIPLQDGGAVPTYQDLGDPG